MWARSVPGDRRWARPGPVSLAPRDLTSAFLLSGTVRPLTQLARGWRRPGRAAAGGAHPEFPRGLPSCRGTPWWRAETTQFEAAGRLWTLVLLGGFYLLSRPSQPFRPGQRLRTPTPFSLGLIPVLSGSLGLTKVHSTGRGPSEGFACCQPSVCPSSGVLDLILFPL